MEWDTAIHSHFCLSFFSLAALRSLSSATDIHSVVVTVGAYGAAVCCCHVCSCCHVAIGCYSLLCCSLPPTFLACPLPLLVLCPLLLSGVRQSATCVLPPPGYFLPASYPSLAWIAPARYYFSTRLLERDIMSHRTRGCVEVWHRRALRMSTASFTVNTNDLYGEMYWVCRSYCSKHLAKCCIERHAPRAAVCTIYVIGALRE